MNGRITLTSDIINKTINLYSKKKKEKIVVYVEGQDDITFWGAILEKYKNYDFEIKRAIDCPKSSSNGCDQLNKLLKDGNIELGKNIIFCIDSDYRYILENYSGYEGFLNKFVFETKVHSRECVLIHPIGIDKLIKSSIGIYHYDIPIDFIELLINIGDFIFDFHCLFLYLHENKNEKKIEIYNATCDFISQFSNTIDYSSLNNQALRNNISSFKEKIELLEIKVIESESIDNGSLKKFKEKIINKISEKWMILFFFRGHDLYELLISKIIVKVSHNLQQMEKERREENGDKNGVGELFKQKLNPCRLIERRNDLDNALFFSKTIEELDKLYR